VQPAIECGRPLIVKLLDRIAGAAVYINPEYVMSLHPDPTEPTRITMAKHWDGESIRVHSDHQEVADRLAQTYRPTLLVFLVRGLGNRRPDGSCTMPTIERGYTSTSAALADPSLQP
jgi:hypothetical protein